MSEEIEAAVLSLYAKGMSTREIEEQIAELYGVSISPTTVSNVINKVLEAIKSGQECFLEAVYFIIWMDGISFKVHQDNKMINRIIYLVIGLNNQGYKEVLGMWLHEIKSAFALISF